MWLCACAPVVRNGLFIVLGSGSEEKVPQWLEIPRKPKYEEYLYVCFFVSSQNNKPTTDNQACTRSVQARPARQAAVRRQRLSVGKAQTPTQTTYQPSHFCDQQVETLTVLEHLVDQLRQMEPPPRRRHEELGRRDRVGRILCREADRNLTLLGREGRSAGNRLTVHLSQEVER